MPLKEQCESLKSSCRPPCLFDAFIEISFSIQAELKYIFSFILCTTNAKHLSIITKECNFNNDLWKQLKRWSKAFICIELLLFFDKQSMLDRQKINSITAVLSTPFRNSYSTLNLYWVCLSKPFTSDCLKLWRRSWVEMTRFSFGYSEGASNAVRWGKVRTFFP